MDKKTVLAIVLSLILVMGYQFLFMKPEPQSTGTARVEEKTAVSPQEDIDAKSDISSEKKKLVKEDDASKAGRDIEVHTPLFHAVLSTKGGALKAFQLNKYRENLEKDSVPIEMVTSRKNMNYPLTVTFPDSNIDIPADAIYEANKDSLVLVNDDQEKNLVFTWSYPDKIRIEKIYSFYPDTYSFDLEVRVHNLSDTHISEEISVAWNEYVDPDANTDRYSHEGPVAFEKNSFVSENAKKLDEPKLFGPGVLWAGFESKYFISSMISQKPSLTNLVISKDERNVVSVALRGQKNLIPPGQTGIFRYDLYIGPKNYDQLKAQGVGLENSINFGSWIKWLALPLLKALNFIENFVGNYGVAIIILTILIKLIFWPLGTISYRSMKGMQKLQPEMLKIREKYKDDKAKIQQETMALYRAHKVNPMSGCLPMLIQIPVFFGLYRALLYSIELRHSPFFLWIQDLSAKDPYYVTPVIMGATMFLQQKMSPAPGGNEMQAKIMLWMPVIFTFLFLNFPSGLVIYWLFNNILSIGQQYYINKRN
ncbi:MAG: membrane protein insertase YidC [Syntrophales bacterium]|jgi:YidC/Oxa1 family membrane protein insertase|nr:membrane protein insertase YidC [Syntrophales bacterium]MDY0044780.1 membrane protein insertase YidC [Syntrophales bacterium]